MSSMLQGASLYSGAFSILRVLEMTVIAHLASTCGCTSLPGKGNIDSKSVSFHGFPTDPALYKKWIIAIRKDEGANFTVGKSTKVCSKHFRETDYVPGVASGYRLLRDTAVPSVFSFVKDKKIRKPPKQRAPPATNTTLKQARHTVQASGSTESTGSSSIAIPVDASMCSDEQDTESSCERPQKTDCSTRDLEPVISVAEEQEKEIRRLQDRCTQLEEQLTAAREAARQLQAEKEDLANELAEERRKAAAFCIESFKDCDQDVTFYTGLPDYSRFIGLLLFLRPEENGCDAFCTDTVGDAKSSTVETQGTAHTR
uniref:THAP-type domain-containing protein n=1 Tax=Amblyomma maculatum TaxID=34609 RepID=G3MTP4_AMBMU